ncbi:MAG: glycosyltransferase family 2 protein [Clostridiales bacterium]|nr:glycosyltransferase family 2 protein [Clostridiales bacterium]
MGMVSIVMATYNGEKYLEEQIESILSSTFQDFEIYIYDDGSKDSTMEILNKYNRQYPDKIKVFQNEKNLGVTRNFLNAVNGTRSDYVMFCDQDDVWKKDKIARTLKRMRQMEVQFEKELPIAVFTDAHVVDGNLGMIHESFFLSGRLNPKLTDLPHLLMENKLIGCTVMINAALRKVLQSSPLPEKARLHDGWIGLIASSLGKVGFIKEATLLYRQHESNVVGNKSFLSYILNRVGNLRKQKRALLELQHQAGEFARLYQDLIDESKLELITRFSKLHQENFVRRRIIIIQNKYLKTGIIRNIGLMIIV